MTDAWVQPVTDAPAPPPGDPVPMPWKRPGSATWEPMSHQVGTGFSVYPVRGLSGVGNWGLNPYHRRGLGNLAAQVWRMFSGAYLRREHPKTAKALAKALAECQVWCDHENEAEATARAIHGAVTGDPE